MQVIKQAAAAGAVSLTTGYALRGLIAIGGTVVVSDGAGRNVMELAAAGTFMLADSPIQMTGLSTAGTATAVYLYVE